MGATESAHREFDGSSQQLKKSTDDDKFVEVLEEFFKIMYTNEVDEEELYKHFEFSREGRCKIRDGIAE